MSSWILVLKWSIAAFLAAPPLFVLSRPALRGDVEVGGLWFILLIFLLLPALIYAAGVSTKWGIVGVGMLLLLVTARTWLIFESSDPYNSLNGLIPIVGLIPTVVVASVGAVADLSYRFFRETPVRGT